jgi:hypothetical protein
VVVHHGIRVMPVMVVAVMTGELVAGEEDRRDDVQDASDDHDPGRDLVEPWVPGRNSVISGRSWGGGTPHSGGFWYFTHALNDASATNSCHYAPVMYQL